MKISCRNPADAMAEFYQKLWEDEALRIQKIKKANDLWIKRKSDWHAKRPANHIWIGGKARPLSAHEKFQKVVDRALYDPDRM